MWASEYGQDKWLARNVFHCPVDDLPLDSSQIAEWQAYDQLEPIDHAERIETACAIVAKTIADVHRSKGESFTLEDFAIDYRRRWRDAATLQVSTAKLADQFDAFADAFGLTWE